jgi:hypothetical protein
MRLTLTVRMLRLAVILLLGALFCWGLHSKLCLYKTHSPARSLAVAKIIQDKQAAKLSAIAALKPMIAAAWLTCVAFLLLRAPEAQTPLFVDDNLGHLPDWSPPPLLSRPPPSR